VGDVISGQVQATFTSGVSLLSHVRVGTLRALGVSTRERLSIAREILAIAETPPGFDLSAWLRRPKLTGWRLRRERFPT
jgi:tripartite-type tricarboxylate transporter receptor subunit TctC